jgi:hypothetical protein
VDPDTRTAILAGGLAFCVFFALMTVSVAAESGLDVFTFTAFLIIALIAVGLIGAIRNPPDE